MEAVHVVAGLDRRDGGPSYSVPRLCRALRAKDCSAKILTVEREQKLIDPYVDSFKHDGSRIPLVCSLRISNGLRGATNRSASEADIVHVHGLWLMPNVYAGFSAYRKKKPLIVSPRGMLAAESLKFSARKKKIFWYLLQRRAYSKAAVWHATCLEEANEIREFGIRSPIAIVPNGVDIAESSSLHDPSKSKRTLLYLSRLHAKKGLGVLINAWADISLHRANWELAIAGPDEDGHRASLEKQIEAIGAQGIRFLGSVYGLDKEALLRSSDLFVLPTKNENFGIAVAEALGAGIPAIVTRGAPWAGLETENCGWWIEQGQQPLVSALLEAMALSSEERRSMGVNGRDWMKRDFCWTAIADKMFEVYAWLLGDSSVPDCVMLD